jgi:hypothetical protein
MAAALLLTTVVAVLIMTMVAFLHGTWAWSHIDGIGELSVKEKPMWGWAHGDDHAILHLFPPAKRRQPP